MKIWRSAAAALVCGALIACGLASCSREQPAGTPAPQASPYVAMARGWVDVEGGLIRVVARRDGVVDQVRVTEGDTVKAGDVLAVLDQRDAEINVAAAQAELEQSKARGQLLAAKLPVAERQAQRISAAAAQDAASGAAADEAQAAVAEIRAEMAGAHAAVEVAKQRLAAALHELAMRVIRAPAAGRVVRSSVYVGDSVSTQAKLFQLLPARPRIVRAELNEDFVAKVRPGMTAAVVLDADESQVYRARVLWIGDVFGASTPGDDSEQRADARAVQCVLALDDAQLRVGQRVLVRFKP